MKYLFVMECLISGYILGIVEKWRKLDMLPQTVLRIKGSRRKGFSSECKYKQAADYFIQFEQATNEQTPGCQRMRERGPMIYVRFIIYKGIQFRILF